MKAPLKEPVLLAPLDNFLPQVTEHSRRIFLFPDSGHGRDVITQHMRNAFIRLMDAIPWIAGTVSQIKHEHQHGRLAITAPWKTVDDLLTVNNLDHLDYRKMKAEHFPIKYLKEEEVWPQHAWTERPTMQAQINFVRGGIILSVRAAHSVTDGHGLLVIINVWAAYCRGEDGSFFLGSDSMNRGRLMSGPPTKLTEFPAYTEVRDNTPAPALGLTRIFPKMSQWISSCIRMIMIPALRIVSDMITYRSVRVLLGRKLMVDEGTKETQIFFFSAAKLQKLKEAVMERHNAEEKGEDKGWISTHDALASLIWCCINQTWKDTSYFDRDTNIDPLRRLRLQYALRTSQPISFLAFFVNGRRFVRHPPLQSYIGNVILLNSLPAPLDSVGSNLESVARYAYALRRKVHQFDEDYLMRLVGALGTVPDITRTRLSRSPFPEISICINSWAGMGYYKADWGSKVGGRADRIRVSTIHAYPFCLVLPKLDAADGWSEDECGLEVVLHLKSIYMQKLKKDNLFNKFAEWRCS